MDNQSNEMDLLAALITLVLWLALSVLSVKLIFKHRNNLKFILSDKKELIYLLIGSIVLPIISRLSFVICDKFDEGICSLETFENNVSQAFGILALLIWLSTFFILSIVFLIGLINPKYIKYEKRINIFVTSFLILFYSGIMTLVFLITTNFGIGSPSIGSC